MHILFLVFVISLAVFLVAGFVGWRAAARYLEKRRQAQLAVLRSYLSRLQVVTAKLLSLVDEIDQAQKFEGADLPADWSGRFGQACLDVVTLSESIGSIERRLGTASGATCRDEILRACCIAQALSARLAQLQGAAGGGRLGRQVDRLQAEQ